jgi:tRNA threonylcarbamoyladenosine biosynthesis protein TsaB
MIISIDASTTGCSAALFDGPELVSSSESRIERSSAEMLTTLIENVLFTAKVSKKNLDAVAVARGPGSYTGLRIAVSTAKGLAFALDKPLLSYGTLDVLAQQVYGISQQMICPMIDARRMEVYAAFYDGVTKKRVSDVEAVIVDSDSFADVLETNTVLFIGEGSTKCRGVIEHPNAKFLEEVLLPSAKYSGPICYEKYRNGDFEDLILFEPYYLKEYMFKTKKP